MGANNWRKEKRYFDFFNVLLGDNSKFVGSDGSGDGVSGGSDIIILEGVGFGLSSSATMRRKTLKAQW